jgi:hypothetical protein
MMIEIPLTITDVVAPVLLLLSFRQWPDGMATVELLPEARLGHHLAPEFTWNLFGENDPPAAPVFHDAYRHVPILLGKGKNASTNRRAKNQRNAPQECDRVRVFGASKMKIQRVLQKSQMTSVRHANVFP